MTNAWIGRVAGAISARTPVSPPRLLGSSAAKVLGGLAALLVLAGLIAGLAFLPANNVEAQGSDANLIDVGTLAQLDAIRLDLNGDGHADNSSNDSAYSTAFGTPSCAGAAEADSTCTGYELTADLDFDTDGDGATHTSGIGDAADDYYNSGQGWDPIGLFDTTPGDRRPYTATFHGRGHTISNLFIARTSGGDDNQGFGLFAYTDSNSVVRGVGLNNVHVTGRANTGSLIGRAEGRVYATYATGSVTGTGTVGGLIAHTRSTAVVAGSWADVDVTADSNLGGLVGLHVGGDIIASYATGSVTVASSGSNQNFIGGLVGSHRNEGSDTARIIASYSTGEVSNPGSGAANGLVGTTQGSPITTNSYWDTTTSGTTSGSHGTGYATSDLITPTGYTGIYSAWDVNVDGASGNDDPWHFGTASQHPALKVDFDGDGVSSSVLELGLQREPAAVTITARLVSGDLSISWEDGAGGSAADSYEYRYNTDGSTWGPTSTGTGDDAGWTDTTGDVRAQSFTISAPLSDTYDIEVRAVNAHADSPGPVKEYQAIVANLQGTTDYDKDDDNLIEITNLDQLNAIRYDLDGDGYPASGNETDYAAAFPDHVTGMGCSTICTGYELFDNHPANTDSDLYTAGDLDFGISADYAVAANEQAWTSGSGWEPINGFAARFYGNGYGISNLFINRPTTDNVGLFGSIGATGQVAQFALKEVNVTGQGNVGGLAGQNSGDVRFTYVTGSANDDGGGGVKGRDNVGGAVGDNLAGAKIRVVWTSVDVDASRDNAGDAIGSVKQNLLSDRAGGLVGSNTASGTILISYATGKVTARDDFGGLVGGNDKTDSDAITGSYWDTEASGVSVGVGTDDADYNGMIDGSETVTAGVIGKTTAELKAPTDLSPGIYETWDEYDIYGDDDVLDNPHAFGVTAGQDYPKLTGFFRGEGGLSEYDADFGPQHLGPVSGLSGRVTNNILTVSWDHYRRYFDLDTESPVCAGAVPCYEYRTRLSGIGGNPGWSNVPATRVDALSRKASFATGSVGSLSGVYVEVRPKPVLGVMGRTATLRFTVPGAPTGVTAAITNTGLQVSWTPPKDTGVLQLIGYSVQYRQGNSGPWSDATHTGTGRTAAIALTNPEGYQVQVAARNPLGLGPYVSLSLPTEVQSPVTAPDTAPTFGATTTILNRIFTVGTDVGTITLPEATGADGTLTYTLSPALPAGLSFNANRRTITGTPTTEQAATTYTYTATDDDGTADTADDDTAALTFSITVRAASKRGGGQQPTDSSPTFSSSSLTRTYTVGSNVSLQLPAATGGDGTLSYSLSPSTWNGLTFSAGNRQRRR